MKIINFLDSKLKNTFGHLGNDSFSIVQKMFADNFHKNIRSFKYMRDIIKHSYKSNGTLVLSCSDEVLLNELIPLCEELTDRNIMATYCIDDKDCDKLMYVAELCSYQSLTTYDSYRDELMSITGIHNLCIYPYKGHTKIMKMAA